MPSTILRSSALILVLLGIPAPCFADANSEALQHYQEGVQLFHDGAYEAALVELQTAYRLAPTYKLLYNIAQVQKQLNDFARAYESYDRYLTDGGSDVAPPRRAEVRGEMSKLALRIARLQIVTNAKRPEISIDDVVVSKGPLAGPINVNAGRRRVTVNDDELGARTRVVDLTGGATVRIDVSFTSSTQTGPGVTDPKTPAPTAEPERGPIDYTPAWISAGVTGALLVGGAVSGALALSAKSDFTSALNVGPNNDDAINHAHDSVKSRALVADILFAGAIASAAVTTIIFATRHPKKNGAASAAVLQHVLRGTIEF